MALAHLRKKPRRQRFLRLQRGRVIRIDPQRLQHVKTCAVARRIDQLRVLHALGGESDEIGQFVRIGLQFIVHTHRVLCRLHLFARFRELRSQKRNAAAVGTGHARRRDRGRRVVQTFFEHRVFGARQQALANLREAGAGRRVAGVARLRLAVKIERIVARGLGQSIRCERGRGLRKQRRFLRRRTGDTGAMRRSGFLLRAPVCDPNGERDRTQGAERAGDEHTAIGLRLAFDRSGHRRAPALLVIFLDRRLGEQFGTGRRHGFVDESIDCAGADQPGERSLCVPVAGDLDHEIRELTFDLSNEYRSELRSACPRRAPRCPLHRPPRDRSPCRRNPHAIAGGHRPPPRAGFAKISRQWSAPRVQRCRSRG